ncbi:restriction endonuclease subunit S [Asaia bogorensis]|uniref:restriction endonuclease subunit S n=1 Tax=Asaia bogorensis TaxID=91915 RepID=UPI000EFC5E04|nr:restriction endonuclease subunit S [Asaia bogorensis]
MLPEGWDCRTLDLVTKITDCRHKTPKSINFGIPIISPGDISWGKLNTTNVKRYINPIDYFEYMGHCAPVSGDIVFGRNQNVGVASYVSDDKKFILGQDTVLISPLSVDASYVYYYLQSDIVQNNIKKIGGGSTFFRINLKDIRNLKIIFPPLLEQKKIAAILSTWDRAIEVTEKLLANSQHQKKALMQQLLTGKKRLPGFTGEWLRVSIAQIVKTKSGNGKLIKGVLNSMRTANSFPAYSASGQDLWLSFYEHDGAAIIVSAVGSRCGKCFLASGKWSAIANTHIIWPKEGALDNYFLLCLIDREDFWIRGGSGQPFVKMKDSLLREITLPSFSEQKAIASVLTKADEEITLLESDLSRLRQEKKALMQQLLTGKRRVKIEADAG